MQRWGTDQLPGFGKEDSPLLEIVDSIRRIEHAQYLLRYTDATRKEEADECLRAAGGCLNRYLMANGGREYMEALHPLERADCEAPVFSVTPSRLWDPVARTYIRTRPDPEAIAE